MKNFYNKENYSQKDIEDLISDKIEENLYLEFKRAKAVEDQKEITKDVTSFANAGGGIIIYGVEENNHVASKLDFIDGGIITKEKLEHIINGKIQRKIENLEIIPIRFDSDIKKSIYLVKIPQSQDAPHMAFDHRFYKKQNFQSIPMEEFEVRNTYSRVNKSNLEIDDLFVGGASTTGNRLNPFKINVLISIPIKNIGNIIDKDFKLKIKIRKEIMASHSFGDNLKLNLEDKMFYEFDSYFEKNLFPEDTVIVAKINVEVTYKNINILKEIPLQIKLFYSGGIKEKQIRLFDIITLDGRELKKIELKPIY